MESSTLCVVKLTPSKDCFVSLPRQYLSFTRRLSDVSIVKICLASDPSVQLLCSVIPEVRNGQEEGDVVTMSPSLGIKDMEPVLIMRPREQSLGVGVKVFISPASETDWQILQLNRAEEKVQCNEIVSCGQFCIKCNKKSHEPFSCRKMSVRAIQEENEVDIFKRLTGNLLSK